MISMEAPNHTNNRFCTNLIKTSKYSPYNFLFLNLMVQFMKASNIYFVIITIMQLIPEISVTNGQSGTLVPLIMVVIASMIKDAFEDWKRHQNDKKENEDMLTEVYDI